MATKIGLKCKLFYGTAGAQANTEAKNVKDVTLSLEAGSADITTRAANGWRVKVATLKEGSLEFGMNYDPADTVCTTIMNNFLSNTAIAFFVTDGDGNGLDADFTLTNCSIEQPLEEAVSVSVTAEPTNIGGQSGRAPQWVGSGSGSGSAPASGSGD